MSSSEHGSGGHRHENDNDNADGNDDMELMKDWIGQLSTSQMRDVLNYMLLLNGEAVEQAMKYVTSSPVPPSSSSSATATATTAASTAGKEELQSPPLRRKSKIDDEQFQDSFLVRQTQPKSAQRNTASGSNARSSLSPSKRSSPQQSQHTVQTSNVAAISSSLPLVPAATVEENDESSPSVPSGQTDDNDGGGQRSSTTPHQDDFKTGTVSFVLPPTNGKEDGGEEEDDTQSNSSSSRRSGSQRGRRSRRRRKTLVVLCRRRPKSSQQAEDQDRTMTICRHLHLNPYLLMEDSPNEDIQSKCHELLRTVADVEDPTTVSFPQFFLQYQHQAWYVGDYDHVEELIEQGDVLHGNSALLKVPKSSTTTTTEIISPTSGKRRTVQVSVGSSSKSPKRKRKPLDVLLKNALENANSNKNNSNEKKKGQGGGSVGTNTSTIASLDGLDDHDDDNDDSGMHHGNGIAVNSAQTHGPNSTPAQQQQQQSPQSPHQGQSHTSTPLSPLKTPSKSSSSSSRQGSPKNKSLRDHIMLTSPRREMIPLNTDHVLTDAVDGENDDSNTDPSQSQTRSTSDRRAPTRTFSRSEEISLGDDLQAVFGPRAVGVKMEQPKQVQNPAEKQKGGGRKHPQPPSSHKSSQHFHHVIHEGHSEEDSSSSSSTTSSSNKQNEVSASAPQTAVAVSAAAPTPRSSNVVPASETSVTSNTPTIITNDKTNQTVASSPGGTWTLRETVQLKPTASRKTSSSAAGAGAAPSDPSTDYNSAKVALKPPSERQPIQTGSNEHNLQSKTKNLPAPKRNIVNPYYALEAYGGAVTAGGNSEPAPKALTPNHLKDPPPQSNPPAETPPSVSTPQATQQYSNIPSGSGHGHASSWEKAFVGRGACYLVYDVVGGHLDLYYSEIPIVGAVGVWTTTHDPNIMIEFKNAQGLGQSELIGNCAAHVTQDRHHYYNGWCQFIKAAKSLDATVTVMSDIGVPVDFYLYVNGTTTKVDGTTFSTAAVDAIACVPKNAAFPTDGVKGKKWIKAAKKLGGSVAAFAPLSSKDGDGGQGTANGISGGNTSNVGSHQPPASDVMHTPIPEDTPIGGSMSAPVQQPPPQHHIEAPGAPAARAIYQPQVARDTPKLSVNTSMEPPSASVTPAPVNAPPAPAPALTPLEPLATGAYASAMAAPSPTGGACYLVYEPDSSGRLVEHYSHTPVEGAIGRWAPSATSTKKIAGFKFKRNVGRNVLIGNCAAGVQGRKNYCSGWCQFVRSAKSMESDVILWDPVSKGMMVDVYLYYNDARPNYQTKRLEAGKAYTTTGLMAVACIPKSTPFFEGMCCDILKWLADGGNYGYSSKM